MNIQEKAISFPKTLYNGSFFTEWEKEYELSAEFPDISNLIRIDSSPKIFDSSQNGTNIHIDGTNVFNIIYHSSEDEKLHFVTFEDSFNLKEDIKISNEALFSFARIFCVYISCKVISPRKIYIKTKNKITLDVKQNNFIIPQSMDESKKLLYFKKESFPIQTIVPPSVNTFNLAETFTLDGTYPPIEKVIYSSVKLIPLDLVKNVGSVILNANANFKLFYESENDYVMFFRSVPITLTIDDESIDENTLLYYFLSVPSQSVEIESDNYGENRLIKFSYTPNFVLFKIFERSYELPIDIFSPTEIIECKNSTTAFEELCGIINRTFTIEKTFEISNIEFIEIFDTSAVIDVESFESSENGKQLLGMCTVSVLGKTQEGIDSANFNVSFNQIFSDIKDTDKYDCYVFPIQASSNISGRNTLTIRISSNATIRHYKEKSYSIVTETKILKEREKRPEGTITLYYPSQSESLWDISKEYGISPEIISKENPNAFSYDGIINGDINNIYIP